MRLGWPAFLSSLLAAAADNRESRRAKIRGLDLGHFIQCMIYFGDHCLPLREINHVIKWAGQPESPKLQESDKRHRREIANSNERRRMQCINAGFSSLRALIPQLEGEKLSKAAILQHTTEYITSLEKEKRRLQLQVDHYMRLLSDMGTQGQERTSVTSTDGFAACTPPPSKRKKRITESSDEGVGALSDESDEGSQVSERLRQENLSLNHQLDAERQRCQAMEERNQVLESQLYSMLQSQQSSHVHSLAELAPVKIESQSNPVHESLYNREVVEVIGSRGMPTPPREDSGQHYSHLPPRPMSPTPERGMAMESSSSSSIMTEVSATPQPHAVMESRPASIHYNSAPLLRASLSVAYKEEAISFSESSAPGVTFSHVPAAPEQEKRVETTAITTAQDQEQPMRTYQHRDHPRRRHRQQARLERQRAQQEEEEKLRRQEQEKEQQYQDRVLAPPLVPVPQPQAFRPTQNLENLVEAIRHIEGEAALCDPGRLYEEEHSMYEKRQAPANSSEESSSMSDPDELKSESSGRDSPLQQRLQHHPYHQHHLQQQQHSILSDRRHLQLSNASPSLSSLSISSVTSENESGTSVPVVSGSLSDYQSPAAFLLHQSSSHPSPFYRPGVIVHKQ
ncbi:hypothetical protein RRG08_048653 [Elysia crispata]|uniref:BHLH domain-containing protein n=1 Tax=Elysia crispata TaxID=231223 RepID=A0AAE1DWG7_9GAST|nr:hypothetical protein RRG08_048653 [Elysia crispata]